MFSNLFSITLPNIEKYFLGIYFSKKNYFPTNKQTGISVFSLFFSSSATTHDLSLLTPFSLSTTKHQHCHRDTISPLSLSLSGCTSLFLSLSLYPRVSLTFFAAAATITHHHMGCQDKLDICGATSAIDLDAYMRCVCP